MGFAQAENLSAKEGSRVDKPIIPAQQAPAAFEHKVAALENSAAIFGASGSKAICKQRSNAPLAELM